MGKVDPVLPLGFLKFWAAPPVLDMVPLADNEDLVISKEVQVRCPLDVFVCIFRSREVNGKRGEKGFSSNL
ncbi:hypothetical protein SLA2020_256250 [Shorea laevis]